MPIRIALEKPDLASIEPKGLFPRAFERLDLAIWRELASFAQIPKWNSERARRL
jgi:hypothetical protein